jgi:hypothetical protein
MTATGEAEKSPLRKAGSGMVDSGEPGALRRSPS